MYKNRASSPLSSTATLGCPGFGAGDGIVEAKLALTFGEQGPNDELPSHCFDDVPERADAQVRALLQLRDRGLVDAEPLRELDLGEAPRGTELPEPDRLRRSRPGTGEEKAD